MRILPQLDITRLLAKRGKNLGIEFLPQRDASLMDMNSFSPLMPTSPLSMINQVKFEDEPDLKDLFITVDEPESHVTTIETFITYRIITKTSRGEFDSSEFEVRRRYQDFLWLKEKLEEAHPTLIIPPLPEKFIVKGMVERFNDDFIETRRKALHKFLNRIADHPTLTFNEDFKIFLTAEAWEFSSHKKQGPGLLSRMGQSVRAVALSMKGVKSRPEEFMEMNNFIEIFSHKINLIDKISQRIYKEEREYLDEMKEYGPIHILWSASEEDLADTLKSVASCIDECCKATEKRMSGLSEALLPVVHEYVLYSEMLMAVMKRRDQIQAELDSKVEALTSKKADTDLLTEEIGKLEDKVECANNALKADWDRWRQNMQNDIKSAFTNMAEENILYYEQSFVASGSFPVSWLFASGGQSTGGSFIFSISPSSEYSGFISFRIYWFDFAVQGTLKSLLQYHSSKTSILWHSAFFMVQLSHLYMTTGKTT
ncbi:sorting nexin-7 isoform X2 [Odocoileus virginianus]|uniref:Sorting nexin-7 isoform X2 n=1 Tax=Odocoileus virginianus TaxID=9874 RepID=A0ABM4I7Q3_ODOVR